MPATQQRRELVSALVRWHEIKDTNILSRNPLARDVEIISPFVNESEASSVATRLWNIFSTERSVITASIADSVGRFTPGDMISIEHPSIGTRNGLVLRVSEDLANETAEIEVLI